MKIQQAISDFANYCNAVCETFYKGTIARQSPLQRLQLASCCYIHALEMLLDFNKNTKRDSLLDTVPFYKSMFYMIGLIFVNSTSNVAGKQLIDCYNERKPAYDQLQTTHDPCIGQYLSLLDEATKLLSQILNHHVKKTFPVLPKPHPSSENISNRGTSSQFDLSAVSALNAACNAVPQPTCDNVKIQMLLPWLDVREQKIHTDDSDTHSDKPIELRVCTQSQSVKRHAPNNHQYHPYIPLFSERHQVSEAHSTLEINSNDTGLKQQSCMVNTHASRTSYSLSERSTSNFVLSSREYKHLRNVVGKISRNQLYQPFDQHFLGTKRGMLCCDCNAHLTEELHAKSHQNHTLMHFHHLPPPLCYSCRLCSSKYRILELLADHIQTHHSDTVSLANNFCSPISGHRTDYGSNVLEETSYMYKISHSHVKSNPELSLDELTTRNMMVSNPMCTATIDTVHSTKLCHHQDAKDILKHKIITSRASCTAASYESYAETFPQMRHDLEPPQNKRRCIDKMQGKCPDDHDQRENEEELNNIHGCTSNAPNQIHSSMGCDIINGTLGNINSVTKDEHDTAVRLLNVMSQKRNDLRDAYASALKNLEIDGEVSMDSGTCKTICYATKIEPLDMWDSVISMEPTINELVEASWHSTSPFCHAKSTSVAVQNTHTLPVQPPGSLPSLEISAQTPIAQAGEEFGDSGTQSLDLTCTAPLDFRVSEVALDLTLTSTALDLTLSSTFTEELSDRKSSVFLHPKTPYSQLQDKQQDNNEIMQGEMAVTQQVMDEHHNISDDATTIITEQNTAIQNNDDKLYSSADNVVFSSPLDNELCSRNDRVAVIEIMPRTNFANENASSPDEWDSYSSSDSNSSEAPTVAYSDSRSLVLGPLSPSGESIQLNPRGSDSSEYDLDQSRQTIFHPRIVGICGGQSEPIHNYEISDSDSDVIIEHVEDIPVRSRLSGLQHSSETRHSSGCYNCRKRPIFIDLSVDSDGDSHSYSLEPDVIPWD